MRQMDRAAAGDDRPGDLVAALEADLTALAAAEADLERDAEVAERTRIERSSITLADRLRGAHGPVEVSARGGVRLVGSVTETGDGWVLISAPPVDRAGVEHLVVLDRIVAVRGLGRAVAPTGPRIPRSMSSVLRAWCRDRAEVSVRLVDGALVRGMASATYADHLELASADGTIALALSALSVLSR